MNKGNANLTRTLNRSSLDDAFFTPPKAVKVLLSCEPFLGVGWEPACGPGNISKCFDPPLISSDLSIENWVYGEKGIDFLKDDRKVDFIITNPPFILAQDFVKHALLAAPKVAMLLRIQFLESAKRYQLFQDYPPIRVYVFSGRVKCYGPIEGAANGVSSQCLAWFVWERGFTGDPSIKWLQYRS